MTFVLTHPFSAVAAAPGYQLGARMSHRLRRLGAPLQLAPQQRAERYVSRMPTAVLAG